MRVGGLIRAGQAYWFGRTIDRDDKEIQVGGPCLFAAAVSRRVDNRFAVRRKGNLFRPAERLGGYIHVQTLGDIHGFLTVDGANEEVRAAAILPGVPVSDEK